MRILQVRNVHEALPKALKLLDQEGVERQSRNGPVRLGPGVVTIYKNPLERVIFWSARDANPFFHLYEALWMLAGRNDVAGPARYTQNMTNYSDDGKILHGAYGYRWRTAFDADQLVPIARALRENPDDRRCVLQMWDAVMDLGRNGRDVPCNLTATFQRGSHGELNLVVFCRSNDIVWGAYGANAVHFSFLLEYMALWIGCPVGTYTQISVNWHGYLKTLKQVEGLRPDGVNYVDNPYTNERVHVVPMGDSLKKVDRNISELLTAADSDTGLVTYPYRADDPWAHMVHIVLRAHELWHKYPAPQRFELALDCLSRGDQHADWIVAAREWVQRRQYVHDHRQ
jgi:thymidylate synthase